VAAQLPLPLREEAPMSDFTTHPPEPSVVADMTTFPGEAGDVRAYLARPNQPGPHPGVLICHENRGLLPHFCDVARRLAAAGYVAMAVDVLSREGGTDAAEPAIIPEVLNALPREQIVADFHAGVRFLQAQPDVRADRIGMMGFCFGGGITWRCATQIPELRAAVPFYGPNPPLEDVPDIQCAVLALYGENDTRINAGIDAITAEMVAHGKVFSKLIYPGADHAFFNDTGQRYHPEAATDAWARLLAWFEYYLMM